MRILALAFPKMLQLSGWFRNIGDINAGPNVCWPITRKCSEREDEGGQYPRYFHDFSN